jgi:hypothetical protein
LTFALKVFYILGTIEVIKGVFLEILASNRADNPQRSNIKYYPEFKLGGVLAADIDFIIMMVKGREVKISSDFMTDVVALGTLMKGTDPAPHMQPDEIIDNLLEYAHLSQDLFERTTRIPLGAAIAKVCIDFVNKDQYAFANLGEKRMHLIVADYAHYSKPVKKAPSQVIFEKMEGWPDFLIFYDPKLMSGGVVQTGDVLNQFSDAINTPLDTLITTDDFDAITSLTPDKKLTDEQLNAAQRIISVMIEKRLFSERDVPDASGGNRKFKGWYFCKGCFESFIEKSDDGCKGGFYMSEGKKSLGKCSSTRRDRTPRQR